MKKKIILTLIMLAMVGTLASCAKEEASPVNNIVETEHMEASEAVDHKKTTVPSSASAETKSSKSIESSKEIETSTSTESSKTTTSKTAIASSSTETPKSSESSKTVGTSKSSESSKTSESSKASEASKSTESSKASGTSKTPESTTATSTTASGSTDPNHVHSYVWKWMHKVEISQCVSHMSLVDICADCGYILTTHMDYGDVSTCVLGEVVWLTPQTCTQDGVYTQYCKKCGKQRENSTFPASHDYRYDTESSYDSECYFTVKKLNKCSKCGDYTVLSETRSETPSHYTVYVGATQTGSSSSCDAHYECKNCHKTSTSTLDHYFENGACTRCGYAQESNNY